MGLSQDFGRSKVRGGFSGMIRDSSFVEAICEAFQYVSWMN